MWGMRVCWKASVDITHVWMLKKSNEMDENSVVLHNPTCPFYLWVKNKKWSFFKFYQGTKRWWQLSGDRTRVRKGNLFLLSLQRLFPYRPASSQCYSFLLGRLWVEKWILGFFVCLSFLFVLQVELRQKWAVVRTTCSVTVSCCGQTVAPSESWARCILALAVQCGVLPRTKAKAQNGILGSVLLWGENEFLWLPTLGLQVPVVSPTSLLRTGILVRLLKGNLSSIQHVDMPEWTYIVDYATTILYVNEIDLLEQHKDLKLLLFWINCSSFRQLSNTWHLPGKIWQIWTRHRLV